MPKFIDNVATGLFGVSILGGLLAFQMLPGSQDNDSTQAEANANIAACRAFIADSTRAINTETDLLSIKEVAKDAHGKKGKKGQIVSGLDDMQAIQADMGITLQATDKAMRTEGISHASFETFHDLATTINNLGQAISENSALDVWRRSAPAAIEAFRNVNNMRKDA
jgi:hypothetical protein